MRQLILLLFMICLCAPAVIRADDTTPPPAKSSTATTSKEAELGKKTSEEIEKEYKLVQDEAAVAKLNALAQEIAPFTQRPDVQYTCKILDSNTINAISLPGGIIYFTKGLLDAAESDDELAGVMAHEIAHNALYHVRKSMEKDQKASIVQILTAIAAIYAVSEDKSTLDTGASSMQIIMMSQMVKQSILNGYSVELEYEADKNAVEYLYKSKQFDPMGLYSVMLGFKQMEASRPMIELGYLKTHPNPKARMDALKRQFDELDIPLNLWSVVNFRAVAEPIGDGAEGYVVRLGSVEILTVRVSSGEMDVKARAEAMAKAINRRLTKRDDEIQLLEIRYRMNDDGTQAAIRMRTTTVINLTSADARAANVESLELLAETVKDNIQRAFFNEHIKRVY